MRYIISLILVFMTIPAWAQSSFWSSEWPKTDFSKHNVDFKEIITGGVPKDGIPALNSVNWVSLSKTKLPDREAAIVIPLNKQTYVLPIRYMLWHEIANIKVEGRHLAVTYCPLCNSSIVFDRRLKGEILSFGVTGKLRFSDMIMYDHQSESWWQQFTGKAIVGTKTGSQLKIVASQLMSMGAVKKTFPKAKLMAKPEARRAYGSNPYVNYDSAQRPFLYAGENPPHGIPPMARVVRIKNKAWPLSRLEKEREISQAGVKITWKAGQASSLDTKTLAKGREVGDIRVTSLKTGKPIAHEITFAFVFHAFEPKGKWMLKP